MTGKVSGNIKCLILSLLLISGFISPLFSQKYISGTINKYGRVTSIGTDYVIVGDDSQFLQFETGDTVLLIQMKGVRTYVTDSGYGTHEGTYGAPGLHEFLTVDSLDGANKKIIFRNNIVHTTFNLASAVQIVKVPSYNYAVVNGTLTCAPWDSISKTGGVLAVIAGRTISLNADIDVTGKGFSGGKTAPGLGICIETNSARLYKYSYPALTDSAGFKGEGPVSRGYLASGNYPAIYPGFAKGKGANLSAGGGGNGRFSGGGGGGNYGGGGRGGNEIGCTINYIGGIGGLQIKGTTLAANKGMFLGGGGGASTFTTGTATPGGNGGGMVIIVCDTLKGNSKSILAEGAAPTATATGNAGAGGGGGGGTIALYLQSYSNSPLTVSVNGGKGGNNAGAFGEGGGGGGGLLNMNSLLPANVTQKYAGGAVGTRSGASTGQNGAPGDYQNAFVPVLNGFLFNSIRSVVTGNQVDSICSNVIPKPISGTIPVGGSGVYTYIWQKTYNLAGSPSAISGATSRDYIPTATETNTLWVRRIVKDEGTLLTDTSKWVNIIVQPAITGNLIGRDTTICYNQNPLNLVPLNPGPSNGNGYYKYQWLANTDNATWTVNATGVSTSASYDPPVLTDTTYYKRFVTSGRCIDYSSTVKITVLPSITGNVRMQTDSVICQGNLFETLGASAPGAGSGSFVYQWQDSITAGIWQPATGVNTNLTYTPDTSQFALIEQRYFRRVVYSGPDSVCKNKSIPIRLTSYHKIRNNTISTDNTICSGTIPASITGSTPINGDLTYTYIWQQSTNGITWSGNASGTYTQINYSPPSLNDTTWYRRIVNSSECTNTSKIVVVNVHKPIANNIASLISGPGPDTTICSGAVPGMIKGSAPTGGTALPGDYAYQWSYSTDNVIYNDINVSGTLINYQPGALTTTTWFRRKAISGMCSSQSNSIRIIVLPVITDNVISSAKTTVCYNTVPVQITGTGLTGGAGGTPKWIWQQSLNGITWTTATGTSNQQNYTPPALTVKTWYRRIILSGPADCCSSTSNEFILDIDQLPTGTLTSVTDTTVCSGKQILLKVHMTGAPRWTLVYNENSNQVTVSKIATADTVIKTVPSATGTMTVFNYSLQSVTDNNGCIATLLSGTRKANVYRVPVANAGPDDEICGPKYTLAAVKSDGAGLWTFPAQVLSSVPTDPKTTIQIDSSFTTSSVSYKFYWEETNWQCSNKDSVTIKFFNRIDTISAGRDSVFMSFDNLIQLKAYPLQSFETGKWSIVTGTGEFDDDTKNLTDVRNISIGSNTYKWTVTNGKCVREDLVNMDVMTVVIPEAISPNGDNINDFLIINGLDLVNQGAELSIVNGAGTMIFSTSNKNGSKWNNWDGKNSKGIDLPEGTYYYLLKVTSVKTGLVIQKSGFIILKRS